MATWDKTTDPILPGLYLVLERIARRVINPASRGVVAIVTDSSIVAKRGAVYEVTTIQEVADTLGTNKSHAQFALEAGAQQLLIYVRNDAEDLADALDKLAPYYFDVLTLGFDADNADAVAVKAWREAMAVDGRHFVAVIGAAKGLADDAATQAVFTGAKHGDIAHVGFGVLAEGGISYSGGELAAYLAGAQASRGMTDGSLTRHVIPFAIDVERRLSKAQREAMYQDGIIVPIHNGYEVVLEAGITSDATTFAKGKLRIAYNAAVYQESMNYAIENGFVGQINNDSDGRAVLLAAVDEFNGRLIDEGVLSAETKTVLHPDYPPSGDSIYLMTTGEFIDAAEKFFIEFVATGGVA